MFVVDQDDRTAYAYEMSTGMRQSGLDIFLHADNCNPLGAWIDPGAGTLWVVDAQRS